MVIVETSIFTRQIQALLADDEYRDLQIALLSRPEAGALIPGSGGLRKLRWRHAQRGKRGGMRIIYYWAVRADRILLLLAYTKQERDNLTPKQIRLLRQVVEREYP